MKKKKKEGKKERKEKEKQERKKERKGKERKKKLIGCFSTSRSLTFPLQGESIICKLTNSC